jgi:hypothetical protein
MRAHCARAAGETVMVYSIGQVSVYQIAPNVDTVGGDYIWRDVKFLNPDKVDRLAAGDLFLSERFGQGYAIDPETAPKAMIWKSKTKLPPDYAYGNNSIMLISERFRDLVEQFEPGVHQFLPVAMYFKRTDTEPFDTFYWFICCQLIDSLDPYHTTIPWDGDYDKRKDDGFRLGSWHIDAEAIPRQKPVFSLKAIGDRHLWRDPYRSRGYVHCSNAFGEAIKAADLKGFGLKQFEQT